jgi:hypothetical protein
MHSKKFDDAAFDAAMENLLRQFADPRQQKMLDVLYGKASYEEAMDDKKNLTKEKNTCKRS